ncbi:ribosome-associated protein [Roseateles sp. YR242]|uniref:ribosome biogenesis factor YjgA n=1 Tax=Roseateles sp. YR242 TaxID=1855305 RepID=UPI0008C718DE|nr:ribosome biogenesis factor YjgA [Roseateles sp. YR242]SEL60388.1 ribosome-associated protein [Roseateles sp. YR242]
MRDLATTDCLMYDDYEDPDDERPSKSQLKRDMSALQALGVELLSLPEKRIAALNLPDRLVEALTEARRIKSAHEGKRRQLQLIGKLMRHVDPEPIREAVAEFKLGRAQDSLQLHQAERWRVRLVEEDAALQAYIQAFEDVDVQQLRSLIRAARKDRSQAPEQRNGRAWRELFQLIKGHVLADAQANGQVVSDADADADADADTDDHKDADDE